MGTVMKYLAFGDRSRKLWLVNQILTTYFRMRRWCSQKNQRPDVMPPKEMKRLNKQRLT